MCMVQVVPITGALSSVSCQDVNLTWWPREQGSFVGEVSLIEINLENYIVEEACSVTTIHIYF